MKIIITEVINGYIIEEKKDVEYPNHYVIEDNPTMTDAQEERKDTFKRMLENLCEIWELDESIKVTIVKDEK